MDFGNLPVDRLPGIDFTLPPDPALNKTILKGGSHNAIIRFGTAKWFSPGLATLYPAGTKEKDGFNHYADLFDAIELNATHYKIYPPSHLAKWVARAGDNNSFKFCPKMYQGISHRGSLSGKGMMTAQWIEGIRALGVHLGPCFLQVADSYSPKKMDELFEYLAALPKDLQMFVEVRHSGWYEPETFEALCSFLQENNIGITITDTAARRDMMHMRLTVPKCLVRFCGYDLNTDFVRLNEWHERLKAWKQEGLGEGYFFIHAKEGVEAGLLVWMKKRLAVI